MILSNDYQECWNQNLEKDNIIFRSSHSVKMINTKIGIVLLYLTTHILAEDVPSEILHVRFQ